MFQGGASDPLTWSSKMRTEKFYLDLAMWKSFDTQNFTKVWEQRPDWRGFNRDEKKGIVGDSECQLCI